MPLKLAIAVVAYGLGGIVVAQVLEHGWTGLTVVGFATVLYGAYLSTFHGSRGLGDVLVWLVAACVAGVGVSLLLNQGDLHDPAEVRRVLVAGHVWGVVIAGAAWYPLRGQGALPGGKSAAGKSSD